MLGSAKRDIFNLGDPLMTAALHFFVAQLETKRGLFDAAWHHIRAGRSVLGGQENLWLEGMAAIDASCVCYLTSNFDDALSEARAALEKAQSSGHALTRRASLANLGHLYLALGDYRSAEQCLRDSLKMSSQGSASETAILDGLAQIRLVNHELGECHVLLDSITSGPEKPGHQGLYDWLWSSVTRTHLLLREQRGGEAWTAAGRALSLISDESDRTLSAQLRLLKAEAAAMLGKLDEAAALIYRASSGHDEPSVELLAEIARATGVAVARSGDPSAASVHFDRAARILATVGNLCARSLVLQSWTDAIGRPLPAGPAQTAVAGPDAGAGGPGAVPGHAEMTSAPELVPVAGSAAVVEGAAALLDFAGYPELLGYELLALMRETGCAAETVLVAGAPARREVLAHSGCEPERAAALAAARRAPFRLALGTWHSRSIDLVATPATSVASRATLIAIEKIVRSALWMHKARRDERERAALWPIDAAGEDGQGVFAGEGMSAVLADARRIAPTNIPVLVTGETGTGKEVVARLIHRASTRADKPFVPVNCVAVPRDILDSQLFGYRRGAFTGATADSPGIIRAAAGGSLFLDEIGEIGPDVQPKLLRFLESGEIHPLGEPRPTRADVRIIASTNANLERLVAEGRFREDLFYRLNVVRLRLPPLRERREEIPSFVEHFLRLYGEEFHKGHLRVADETMEYLLLYGWPGNVRELANEMRRLVAMAEAGAVLMPEHLRGEITAGRRTIPVAERRPASTEVVVRLDQPLSATFEHVERAAISYALKMSGGRLDRAARMLRVSRKGLYLKRQRLARHDAPSS